MPVDWINIHTHASGAGISIVDAGNAAVNLQEKENVFCSLGIHPMHIDASAVVQLQRIEQAAKDRRITAIGEAGLDRNSSVPVEEQKVWFERQAEIASRYDLPIIVHVVRAIPELIAVHNRIKPSRPWIVHGFNNKREILRDLIRHGFYISVGKHVMNEKSNAFDLLPEIPIERLFLETDDSDISIADVYRQAACRLKMREEELKTRIYNNFIRLFEQSII